MMIECGSDEPIEHVLSAEDAECCICLSAYDDGAELRINGSTSMPLAPCASATLQRATIKQQRRSRTSYKSKIKRRAKDYNF
ncbi:E3 ubiquitin-protein ligase [Musa troglodytarum]|nr:E3 ubiquitin-protein ligase [Musa troglodytarum]